MFDESSRKTKKAFTSTTMESSWFGTCGAISMLDDKQVEVFNGVKQKLVLPFFLQFDTKGTKRQEISRGIGCLVCVGQEDP